MRVFYPVSDTLGVLVYAHTGQTPFAESRFLRLLAQTGKQAGLRVFLFDPQSWNPQDNTVTGWVWHEEDGAWKSVRDAVPSLAYDRAWPPTPAESERFRHDLHRLRKSCRLRLMNATLPDKWQMHVLLSRAGLDDLLPPTARYEGPASLQKWLAEHDGAVFLKPARGSQGRRVAVCTMTPEGTLRIRGRQADNRPFELAPSSPEEAINRLHRWIGHHDYLMQKWLQLSDGNGSPLDIRALVQKNGRRRWALTGVAARIGMPGTVTANLHGGGTAVPAEALLANMYGNAKAEQLIKQIRLASRQIVLPLEQSCGHFCELGLDFGVDATGKLWFLEANAKPGRNAMAGIGAAAAKASVVRPIACAKSILCRPSGRVTHEFDHQ
jgi:glutathione synthase/RimK-type ligase-like ATP-grasp enzyme